MSIILIIALIIIAVACCALLGGNNSNNSQDSYTTNQAKKQVNNFNRGLTGGLARQPVVLGGDRSRGPVRLPGPLPGQPTNVHF